MQLANHFAILQVKGELDQILCGLSGTLHVLDLIRRDPGVMRSLFVHTECPPVTSDSMFDMFSISYSPPGSNSREEEEAVGLYWYRFLQCIEG